MYKQMVVQLKIPCRQCKKEIIRDQSNRKYCNDCAEKRDKLLKKKWKKQHYKVLYHPHVCEICCKIFNTKRYNTKFCSVKCRNQQRKIDRCLERIQYYRGMIIKLRSEMNG